MKFKFILARHKIHPKVEKYHTQWYLLLDTKDTFYAFINQRAKDLVKHYLNLKENVDENQSDRYKNGNHICNEDEALIANRLSLDDTRKSVVDDCRILDGMLEGYITCFSMLKKIIVSPNNSFRNMDDTFQILDSREVKGIIFPTTSEEDISVKRWANGSHWYVRVGNYDLPNKFVTYEDGLNAGKRLLKNEI